MKLPIDPRGRVLLALKAAGVLVIAILLGIAVHRIFFAGREAREERANAVVKEENAKATGEAAATSMTIVNETNRQITRIDEITRRNEDAITSAAGADATAPGVAAALRDALCLRSAYQREPRCAAVRGDGGSVGPAEPDAWGTPAPE